MTIDRRISLITLGVGDMDRARRFYESLGFVRAAASQAEIAFYALDNVVLALHPRTMLAADAGVGDEGRGFDGVTLAQNRRSRAEVDEALAFAVACGATLAKPATEAHWGGYSGYFADPDGHLWEVAHNPFIEMDEDGNLVLA